MIIPMVISYSRARYFYPYDHSYLYPMIIIPIFPFFIIIIIILLFWYYRHPYYNPIIQVVNPIIPIIILLSYPLMILPFFYRLNMAKPHPSRMTFLRQWAIRDAGFQPQEVADFRVPRCDYLGDFGVMSWCVMEILSRYLTVIYIYNYIWWDVIGIYSIYYSYTYMCIYWSIYMCVCIYIYINVCVERFIIVELMDNVMIPKMPTWT